MSATPRERLEPVAAVDAPELGSDLVDVYEEGGSPPGASPLTLGVWELAWPTILAFLTQTLVRVVSLLMVGSLGQDAVAGVGVANQFFWMVQALGTVAPTGIMALLARAVGARDAKLADAALRQGLWLGLGLGVVATAALLPITRTAIGAYGVSARVTELGGDYLFWATPGMVALTLSLVFGFNLGLVFSVAMVLLAAGYVLYQTSQVLAHYDPHQHVAAALALFSSVALMFWYVIRIFLRARE